MKQVLLLLSLLLSTLCWSQQFKDQNSAQWGGTDGLGFGNGAAITLPDNKGTITNNFEILAVGTAAGSLTATVAGCMRGGTCSGTLGTSSGVASQLITPSAANLNLYDGYKVTVSWTGGDSTTKFIVNRTGTVARLGGSAGGGLTGVTGTANQITSDGGSPVTTLTIPSTFIGPGSVTATTTLGMKGATSGTATFTAPAIAGTVTNPVTSSNILVAPVGSAGSPSYGNASAPTSGMFFVSDAVILGSQSNGVWLAQNSTLAARAGSGITIGWSSAASAAGAVSDTAFSRIGAAVSALGNGTAGNTTGVLQLTATTLLNPVVVASLPSAAANPGMMRRVSDSTTITAEGQTCTGGAAVVGLAFSDGTIWKCF